MSVSGNNSLKRPNTSKTGSLPRLTNLDWAFGENFTNFRTQGSDEMNPADDEASITSNKDDDAKSTGTETSV